MMHIKTNKCKTRLSVVTQKRTNVVQEFFLSSATNFWRSSMCHEVTLVEKTEWNCTPPPPPPPDIHPSKQQRMVQSRSDVSSGPAGTDSAGDRRKEIVSAEIELCWLHHRYLITTSCPRPLPQIPPRLNLFSAHCLSSVQWRWSKAIKFQDAAKNRTQRLVLFYFRDAY